MKIKYFVYNHRDTFDIFDSVLQKQGSFQRANSKEEAHIVFMDWDKNRFIEDIRYFEDNDVPIIIYPHSPIHSIVAWDGIYPYNAKVACNLALSEGQKQIMGLYGYPYRIEVVGWPYTAIREFTPYSTPHIVPRVLLATTHPNTKGKIPMWERDIEDNQRAYEILKKMEDNGFIQLRVRYGHSEERSGISLKEETSKTKASYQIGDAMEDIFSSDVIVANQTFGWLAVALGKPTIMYNTRLSPHTVKGRVASNWPLYANRLSFPIDLFEEPYLALTTAMSLPVTSWRDRYIQKFMPGKFLQVVFSVYYRNLNNIYS